MNKEEIKTVYSLIKVDALTEHQLYLYIQSLLLDDKISLWHQIELILAEEINIARSENQPTSRLTSLFLKIKEIMLK